MSTFSLSFSSRTRSNGLLRGGNETKLAMKATSISYYTKGGKRKGKMGPLVLMLLPRLLWNIVTAKSFLFNRAERIALLLAVSFFFSYVYV